MSALCSTRLPQGGAGETIPTRRFRRACFQLMAIIFLPVGMADEVQTSPFVERMMRLDRNGDGLLESRELPLPLRKQIPEIDANNDQRLSAPELVAHEQQTRRLRSGMTPGKAAPPAATVRGTQLTSDFDQILKFALSFDRNGDGSLDASELKRYASALAVQRTAARMQQISSEDAAYDYEGPISRPGKMQPQTPPAASSKAKGLGADGKGDGGFGDEP